MYDAQQVGDGFMADCVLDDGEIEGESRSSVWGTVKVAVLKKDNHCPDLIAYLVHNTKPVHLLSTAAETEE